MINCTDIKNQICYCEVIKFKKWQIRMSSMDILANIYTINKSSFAEVSIFWIDDKQQARNCS
jgi:hypothetical protein